MAMELAQQDKIGPGHWKAECLFCSKMAPKHQQHRLATGSAALWHEHIYLTVQALGGWDLNADSPLLRVPLKLHLLAIHSHGCGLAAGPDKQSAAAKQLDASNHGRALAGAATRLIAGDCSTRVEHVGQADGRHQAGISAQQTQL